MRLKKIWLFLISYFSLRIENQCYVSLIKTIKNSYSKLEKAWNNNLNFVKRMKNKYKILFFSSNIYIAGYVESNVWAIHSNKTIWIILFFNEDWNKKFKSFFFLYEIKKTQFKEYSDCYALKHSYKTQRKIDPLFIMMVAIKLFAGENLIMPLKIYYLLLLNKTYYHIFYNINISQNYFSKSNQKWSVISKSRTRIWFIIKHLVIYISC
jgi:hypothetical protein